MKDFGTLVSSQAIVAELLQIRLQQRRTRGQGYYGVNRFSPALIRHADHDRLFYGRMTQQNAFYLSRNYRQSPALDHFLDASIQNQKPVFVEAAEIAGSHALAGDDLRSGCFVLPVAGKQRRTESHYFTGLPGLHWIALRVQDV